MIIEVAGTNTWNKGAELMLVAIREHFAQYGPEVMLAADSRFGTYRARARHGLLQKLDVRRVGRSWAAARLMPPSFRKSYGLVTDADVDALLDASGFAFGDQLPADRTVRFAREVEAVRERGKPVILLPQALGPFEKAAARDAFARIAEAANLVFARDEVSLAHARGAVRHPERIQMAPDFTNLVKPGRNGRVLPEGTACIVPNHRMIEKAANAEAADQYVPLIGACIKAVKARGLDPVVLIHGKHDLQLADGINRAAGYTVPLVQEEDPVKIKGMLGQSALVIGSRFHALISGLSQGVPCIATSWSHKYEMLFRAYACEDLILPIPADPGRVQDVVDRTTGAGRGALVSRIQERGRGLVAQVEEMWRHVDRELGLKSA